MTVGGVACSGQVPSWRRRFGGPALLGLCGVMALPLLLSDLPQIALPPVLRFLLLLANPALFVLIAAVVGALLAHRVGLRSHLAGTQTTPFNAKVWVYAGMSGVLLGLGFGVVDVSLISQELVPALQPLLARQTAASTVAGAWYGGLAEEVMLRWGLLSLLAWLFFKAFGHLNMARWMAAALAALVFALAHLPALHALAEPDSVLLLRTVLFNGMAGLLYGAWFLKHDLETAMLAHAATHPGMWLGVQLVGPSLLL